LGHGFNWVICYVTVDVRFHDLIQATSTTILNLICILCLTNFDQFQVKENPGPISGGLAPIYGAAGKMPDRGMVQELLVDFMDGTC
jgi:hypothetical protein